MLYVPAHYFEKLCAAVRFSLNLLGNLQTKMALNLSFVFLSALVLLQVCTWESQATVVRRAADEKNASQTIDEAIQSFKSGLDDLVKNIQNNDLFKNVSETLQQFGQTVQQQGNDLIQKIQTDGKTKQ